MVLKEADITVIGGGPAGYVAAITAAQKKKKTHGKMSRGENWKM